MNRLSQVLEEFVNDLELDAEVRETRLRANWEQVVDGPLTGNVRPVRIENRTLVLAAEDASWRQEATLLAPQIVEAVNTYLDETAVEDVRVIHG